MSEALVIWTFDWVPEGPRGFVRDIRLRWACEEAGLDYEVKSVSFKDRDQGIFQGSRSVRSRSWRIGGLRCLRAVPVCCIWPG